MSRILLVEDNEMNADMLSRRLRRRGFQVLLAGTGGEAISVTRSERPDLILMDMSLPEIDGWEVTRRLKRDESLRRIPIIALTAHALSTDRRKALDAGCEEYETKPIQFNRLLGKIEDLLSGNRSAELAAAGRGETKQRFEPNPRGEMT